MLKNLGHWTEISTDQRAEVRQELDISDVIAEHVRWKTLLHKYLDGDSDAPLDPDELCRDDQCMLGVWLHGAGEDYFSEDGAFYSLRADHAQFHAIAASIVQKVHEKDVASASMLLDDALERITHKIVKALVELGCEAGCP